MIEITEFEKKSENKLQTETHTHTQKHSGTCGTVTKYSNVCVFKI